MSAAVPRSGRIDNVRASREGHAYHEAWAARVALELLVPSTTLSAIALEGFSKQDQSVLSDEAIEVADLVRYRGGTTINTAHTIEIVQFKYSIGREFVPVRAVDLAATLAKFAEADTGFLAQVGREHVERIVRFEFVTNRPLHPGAKAAVEALQQGASVEGDTAEQAQRIQAAAGLEVDSLRSFLARLRLTGTAGSSMDVKSSTLRTIADWGGATDALAKMRLAAICDLVRSKAGVAGQHSSMITRVAMLAALEIAHEAELFPTPDAFPQIGTIVERSIASDIVSELKTAGRPLVIHSAGGMGKTVLMQTVAGRLAPHNAVVLFDCFGAGRWRDPADARHLPDRALPHIANRLAGDGLCDLLLRSTSVSDLMRAFRYRLEQAVKTLRKAHPLAHLVLLLDAIDHAALQAAATRTESFAQLLLQSLAISPIEGVTTLASSRSERLVLAVRDANCRTLPIPAFSVGEVKTLVRQRDADASPADVAVLHARSQGNPRVIDALLRAGRPYSGTLTGIDDSPGSDLLDVLIAKQIEDARLGAVEKGVASEVIDGLLAGLALLPPPVPVGELAAAHGLTESDVESFSSDLFPLIERSPHGLTFRDEPTETFVRNRFSTGEQARHEVIARLTASQGDSTYAARALPFVLTTLGQTDSLMLLAYSDRLPRTATSRVAQRAIRLSRLVAALIAAAAEGRADDMTKLCLEAARVAGGHERSDRFLQEHPDLVAISNDAEATRRLFETSVGWSGARHAALAVANIVADDSTEARLHGRRAFDWLYWQSQLPEASRPHERGRTDDQDRFGPAYVEILSGNWERASVWLDRWREDYAYVLFWHIWNLLERHCAFSASIAPARARLLSVISRCHLRSRALFAAISYQSSLDRDQQSILIHQLADASKGCAALVDTLRLDSQAPDLIDALIAAAIKAVSYGLRSEATDILDHVGLRRPRLAEFDSSWSHGTSVQRCVLSAAIRAAIENRAPSLMDLAPHEIAEAVRPTKRGDPSQHFEAAVAKLLRPPTAPAAGKPSARRRRRKGAFDSPGSREDAQRTLTHRVRPLLPYAEIVTRLIIGGDPDETLTEALNKLTTDVASASDYPYPRGAEYIARTGFTVLFAAVDTLGVFPGDLATRIVDWLVNSTIRQTSFWVHIVSRLSRHGQTHDAAMVLAQRVASIIATDTDIDSRIGAYGALSRAVWLASTAEARVYFRRALEIADAIGSDDSSRASGLIEFGTKYIGKPLQLATIHDFARICELNVPDEAAKFDWVRYTRSLSRLGGIEALGVVARLADREKVDLAWPLGPLLMALVDAGRLDPTLAAGLLGVGEPLSRWAWDVNDFLAVVVPRVPEMHRERVVASGLQELDREYLGLPPADTLTRIVKTVAPYVDSKAPVRSRLSELLSAVTESGARSDPGPAKPPITDDSEQQTTSRIDVGSASEIDAALAQEPADRFDRRWHVRALQRIRETIEDTDDRRRYLEALCMTTVPSLADKLIALADAIETWRQTSTAIAEAAPVLAEQLAARHAVELGGAGWDASFSFRRLVELSGGQGTSLVASLVGALGQRAIDISSAAWLSFACVTASSASAVAIAEALERFVEMSARDLPTDLGDGPWQSEFTVGNNQPDVVAGLLWMRLGSPDARERWRAAHAVHRLVELDRLDVVSLLFERCNNSSAGAFGAQHLPFFHLHAKLWLLIAIARIAVGRPAAVLAFAPQLEAIVFDDAFPHVVMRHFGALALRALVPLYPASEQDSRLHRLDRVNTSPYRRRKVRGRNRGHALPRPDDGPRRTNEFHFDYDFAKYEVDDVANIFGCPRSEVEDMCTTWIRGWSQTVKSMYDCPRRGGTHGHDFHGVGRGGQAGRDLWGGYLAWHSLMLTAGKFLRLKPITDLSWRDEPWVEWLAGEVLTRQDGLWLSDGTDPFPTDLSRPVGLGRNDAVGTKRRGPTWAERLGLGVLAGLGEDLKLRERLVVDGFWDSVDDIDVSVRSVLAEASASQVVGFALALAEPFHQWLPREEDDFRFSRSEPTERLFETWTSSPQSDDRLDRHDPYATPTALSRPRPKSGLVGAVGLKPTDSFYRAWISGSGAVTCRAEAWGGTRGEGRHTSRIVGARLLWVVPRLLEVLTREKKRLVLLIRTQKYLKDRPESERFQTASLIVIVEATGRVRTVRRVPRAVRLAIAGVAKHEQHDFHTRLRLIHELLPAEPIRKSHSPRRATRKNTTSKKRQRRR